MPFAATWMDPQIVILSELSQRKKNIIRYCLHVESKKHGTNKFVCKTEIESQKQKTYFTVTKGKRGEGINWEIGTDIYTLLYIKQVTNKNLLYSTGNTTQYSVMTYIRKESKKEWIYIYI